MKGQLPAICSALLEQEKSFGFLPVLLEIVLCLQCSESLRFSDDGFLAIVDSSLFPALIGLSLRIKELDN